jgi:uncharacterized protein
VPPFDPSRPGSIENLQVVFKTVERCNINCSYCYYFNMGDATAFARPAVTSRATVAALSRWIAQGCRELGIQKVQIAFHGGEPMLMRPALFDEVCTLFRQEIGPTAELSFAIQTNGTVLNERWLAAFASHEVNVGVSVDGDRAANDRYRLDHRGRSTFAATERTLKALIKRAGGNPRWLPSTISVFSRHNDYGAVYRYLRSLGVERMHFLLPDRSADDPVTWVDGSIPAYGKAMFDIFEAWLTEDNRHVHVKFISKALTHFNVTGPTREGDCGRGSGERGIRRKTHQIIVARSDGTVAIDDSYMPALAWYQDSPFPSITSGTLREFLSHPVFMAIEEATSALPVQCQTCTWKRICRGGDLENRFSSERGFDNPSVYCSDYKFFFRNMCDLLVRNGFPEAIIQDRLSESFTDL